MKNLLLVLTTAVVLASCASPEITKPTPFKTGDTVRIQVIEGCYNLLKEVED